MTKDWARRLKYLDVLKAFAIIVVVLYHCGFLLYGYLGVDLFLVINGYFITKSLEFRWLNSNKGKKYIDFEMNLSQGVVAYWRELYNIDAAGKTGRYVVKKDETTGVSKNVFEADTDSSVPD